MSNTSRVLEALGHELDKRKNQTSRATLLARRYVAVDLPDMAKSLMRANLTINDTLIDIALAEAANALAANSIGFDTMLRFESQLNGHVRPSYQAQDDLKEKMHPMFWKLAQVYIPMAGWALCEMLGLDKNVRDRCVYVPRTETDEIRKLLIERHADEMLGELSDFLQSYLPLIIRLAVEIFRERGKHLAGAVSLSITRSGIAHLAQEMDLEPLAEPGAGIWDRKSFEQYLESCRAQIAETLPDLRREIEEDHASIVAQYGAQVGPDLAKLLWGSDRLADLDKVEEAYRCQYLRREAESE